MTEDFILLVEDEPDDVELMLIALRECGDKRPVVVASDGQEAVDRLGRPEALPSLVLLDLKLPKIGGLEVLRRIRQTPRLAALPVAVVTSSDEPKDREEMRRLGVFAYIRKAVDFSEFSDAIRRLVCDLGARR